MGGGAAQMHIVEQQLRLRSVRMRIPLYLVKRRILDGQDRESGYTRHAHADKRRHGTGQIIGFYSIPGTDKGQRSGTSFGIWTVRKGERGKEDDIRPRKRDLLSREHKVGGLE